jgi:hypothetical protein
MGQTSFLDGVEKREHPGWAPGKQSELGKSTYTGFNERWRESHAAG